MKGIAKSIISTTFIFALSSFAVATYAADSSSGAAGSSGKSSATEKSSSGASGSSSSREKWPSFKKVDADSNGAISMDEARSIPGLADSFTQYDKNNDGQLSKSEYESAQKAHKSGKSSSSGSSGSMGSSGAGAGGSSSSHTSSGSSGAGSSAGSK